MNMFTRGMPEQPAMAADLQRLPVDDPLGDRWRPLNGRERQEDRADEERER